MSERLLPAEFSTLEPLVAEWGLTTDKARATKRVETDMACLRRFYGEVEPHIENMILFLNRFPNDPDTLPSDAKRLFYLAQTFMEVAAPIDLEWPSGDIEDTFPMERFGFLI